jgi:ribosomal protein S18 acetylase RimI-like enzyme
MRAVEPRGIRSFDTAPPFNALRPDWCILRDTILESVTTSPDAFLAKADEIKTKSPDFWKDKLKSSDWAVVQRRDEILGIAAAKSPAEIDDYALQERACFIESVWIAPCMRRKGVGERLVTYLIEHERRVGIRQFYLWVFKENTPAKELYKEMEFKPTGRPSVLLGESEIQYLRQFDSPLMDDEEVGRNETARKRDWRKFEITYRMLAS